MTEKIDLQKIENKAWKSFYAKDGLFDLFFGVMVFVGAIRTITDNVWFTIVIFIGILILPLGKRYITTPRLGRVKFSTERLGKQMKLFSGIGITIVVIVLLFYTVIYPGNYPRIIASILIVALIVSVFSLVAYYLDHWRLFVYGVLIASQELIWISFGRTIGAYFDLIIGCIILFIGIFVLFSFLEKYPLPIEEATYGL